MIAYPLAHPAGKKALCCTASDIIHTETDKIISYVHRHTFM